MQETQQDLASLQRRFERERSARLAAEAIAERGLRDLYEKKEQLELLRAIAVIANGSSCVDEVLRHSLQHICQTTGWPTGCAYLLTPEDHAGAPVAQWGSCPGNPAAQSSQPRRSEAHSGTAPFAAPQWLPTGHPQNPCSGPLAPGHPAVATFVLPVPIAEEIVAVLEFSAGEAPPPDNFLLQLMTEIGLQLGRVIERRRTEDRLLHDALHDPLTGLPNRAFFLDRLTSALHQAKRNGDAAFSVLFIDLDHFKLVNDSLGHQVGDLLLMAAAVRLKSCVYAAGLPAQDIPGSSREITLARLGGDEFTILLHHGYGALGPEEAAESILQALSTPFPLAGRQLHISASIGIAPGKPTYTSADELLRDADLAMYHAKARGKACSELYHPSFHATAVRRLETEANLRRALQNNEFVLRYQPIIALSSAKAGKIVGFEALVRWQRPHAELVFPDHFISVAEDTGLIIPLGAWVLRQACHTVLAWQQRFPQLGCLSMSVNLSPRQFAQVDLFQQVAAILDETGVHPGSVRLEITESASMENVERSITLLTQLRALGVRFSMDDFGTGFSSLSSLHRLPLDVLKIDRSFVRNIHQDHESLAIVKTIINLAHGLGMEVVAEGAETEAHVDHLLALRCDLAQGYFYSRPLTQAAAEQLLDLAQASLPAAPPPQPAHSAPPSYATARRA